MFAIAVPSTITLTSPGKVAGEVEHYATLAFSHLGDDVSKCLLTVTTAAGDVHTALFDTQGGVREQRFDSADDLAAIVKAEDEADEERRARDREVALEAKARELKTADDTTAKDVAWDAPHDERPLEQPPAPSVPRSAPQGVAQNTYNPGG
jgi:hypothetical protein